VFLGAQRCCEHANDKAPIAGWDMNHASRSNIFVQLSTALESGLEITCIASQLAIQCTDETARCVHARPPSTLQI
jgi:hypothetical protein